MHLGHFLSPNLSDTDDIVHIVKDLNCKANSILCTFHSTDPFVKSFLIKSYCLSLYGCTLWSLSTSSMKLIEVALNKLLRKVWNLPCNSHTSIVHCLAQVHTICRDILYKRSCSLLSHALLSPSPLVRAVFSDSSKLVYTFTGYNWCYGCQHVRSSSDEDCNAANSIRRLRKCYGLHSPCESIVRTLSCQ